MNVHDFDLVNEEKVRRVIDGEQMRHGQLQGGLGKDAEDAAILAHYDKLGGLIRKDGNKLKMGCFWDFKNNKAFAKPVVVFIYRVNGREIEVPEGGKEPLAVKAQKLMEEADAESREATGDGAVDKKAQKEKADAYARRDAEAAAVNAGAAPKKAKK